MINIKISTSNNSKISIITSRYNNTNFTINIILNIIMYNKLLFNTNFTINNKYLKCVY